jgi:hypothetical protein
MEAVPRDGKDMSVSLRLTLKDHPHQMPGRLCSSPTVQYIGAAFAHRTGSERKAVREGQQQGREAARGGKQQEAPPGSTRQQPSSAVRCQQLLPASRYVMVRLE